MPVDVITRKPTGRLVDATMRKAVTNRLRLALRALDRTRSSITLVFTDDEEIRSLNRAYRHIDRATDVLSFHMQVLSGETDPAGDGIFLGDIVISVETARRRSGPTPRVLTKELERLAVHGLCHLFGHDHHRPAPARRMRTLESRLRRYLPPIGRSRSSTGAGKLPK